MIHTVKKIGLLLLALTLLLSSATGEEPFTEKDGYHFDEKGFLAGENPGDEYILEDEKNGVWQYASKDLAITVTMFREKDKQYKKKTIEYCVAEVWASAESPLSAIASDATKKYVTGEYKEKPEKLIQKHPAMLAVSDDYYGHRIQTRKSKGSTWPVGVVIRNGEVLGTKTRNPEKNRNLPPLDTFAVYGDGRAEVNLAGEKSAEEFQADGATQVFSFGPWLIRDGAVNEKEAGPKSKYYFYREPRAAIGVVEPYHYVLIVVRGEPKNKYIGVKFYWLADKLLEYGCTDALNLDGGGTACMLFNGKTIISGRGATRPLGSMIAFGTQAAEQE